MSSKTPRTPKPSSATPSVGTRDRLLDATELLVAELGPEAVSLRSVVLEAGCNVASIHYYYGNKLALIKAVLERRTPELSARRTAMLEAVEASATFEEIVRAIVTPLAEFVIDEAQYRYAQYLLMLDRAGGEWRDAILQVHQPSAAKLNEAYARAVPHLSLETKAGRGVVARSIFLEILADPSHYFGFEPTKTLVIETIVHLMMAAVMVPEVLTEQLGS